MSLVNLDKSVGHIRAISTEQLVEYEPYEFSAHCLGIISPQRLELGTRLTMDTHHHGSVQFTVLDKVSDIKLGLFRYRLISEDDNVELSKALEIDPNSGRLKLDRSGAQLQSARFSPGEQIYVETKTFGSTYGYNLEVVDFSKTGLLLCAPKPCGTIPFSEKTLLELKIMTGDNKVITPLAKIVRKFTEGSTPQLSRYFATKFVDFNSDEQMKWDLFMESLEVRNIDKAMMALAA